MSGTVPAGEAPGPDTGPDTGPAPETAPETGPDTPVESAGDTGGDTSGDAAGGPVTLPGQAAEAAAGREKAPAVAEAGSGGLARALLEAVVHGGSAVVTVLAIVLALVVGGVLMVLADQDVMDQWGYFFDAPGDALSSSWTLVSDAYTALFEGAILDPDALSGGDLTEILKPISETVSQATPLIFGGIAVSIAFRAGLFNIGAQGQIVAGAIAASWIGWVADLPVVLHLVLVLLGGVVAGALYGGVAGVLKARFGAHEVIVTIMLNHVAVLFLAWLLTTDTFREPGQAQPIGKPAHDNALLPRLFGDDLRVNLGIVLALGAAAFYRWLLHRSVLGFELRAVGANPNAARTAGMSVARAQIAAMLLAGGMAGIVGVSQVMGPYNPGHNLTPSIDAGLGFDAITVALLGRTSPAGVVFAALLFGGLRAGGSVMQAQANVSIDIIIVIQAVIVLFVAAPPLVRSIFRLRGARTGGEGGMVAKDTAGAQA